MLSIICMPYVSDFWQLLSNVKEHVSVEVRHLELP